MKDINRMGGAAVPPTWMLYLNYCNKVLMARQMEKFLWITDKVHTLATNIITSNRKLESNCLTQGSR